MTRSQSGSEYDDDLTRGSCHFQEGLVAFGERSGVMQNGFVFNAIERDCKDEGWDATQGHNYVINGQNSRIYGSYCRPSNDPVMTNCFL